MRTLSSAVLLNYLATLLKLSSGILLLPLILKQLSSEDVGVWIIFGTITSFSLLVDFGFNPSFTRNIAYIYSGVKELKVNGAAKISDGGEIDYLLLGRLIHAMKWTYIRMASIVAILLSFLGTFYLYTILKGYSGNLVDVYISWIILIFINCYNIYSQYYDCLLQGSGLIKESKIIQIIGQLLYILIVFLLVYYEFGLIALVTAQLTYVLVGRYLAGKIYFTKDLIAKFKNYKDSEILNTLKPIYPNAIKIGAISIGLFLIQRSAILIGSVHLDLQTIGSYGVTYQIISIISGLSGIYIATHHPKIAAFFVEKNGIEIKSIWDRGLLAIGIVYFSLGILIVGFGNTFLHIINAKTVLLPSYLMIIMLVQSAIQTVWMLSCGVLVLRNHVPHMVSTLISGVAVLLLLIMGMEIYQHSILVMILAPLIVDLSYQGWRWPLTLKVQLQKIINRQAIKKNFLQQSI